MIAPPPSATQPDQRHSRVFFDESFSDPEYRSLEDPGNARRVAALAEICPVVKSHLDVGCGHGDILRALRHRASVSVGADTSRQGLLHALRQPAAGPDDHRGASRDAISAVQAAADRLPFADKAFDLVSCCDVLEHLPEQVMLRAVHEMARVAGRWVLINVPLEEDLGWSQIQCSSCGHIYHREHHQRAFDRTQVLKMLPPTEFAVERWCTTGWVVRHPVRLPRRLGALLGLGHDPASRCERCGAHPAPLGPRQLLRDSFVLLHNGLTKPLRRWLTKDTEIVVLFRRREGDRSTRPGGPGGGQ